MSFLVTTTGTVGSVTLNDLNGQVIAHPTVDLDLELTFTAQEISESADLQAALNAGQLTASDGVNPITNVNAAIAASHNHLANQVIYDNTASGFSSIDLQDAVDEIDTSLDQIANDIGTINTNLAGYQLISEKNTANGYAGLDATGLISSAQLPSIAITTVSVVADITARDALVVEEGDVSIVLDADGFGNQQSYIYDGAAWQILSVSGVVTSVAGKTGAVLLDLSDLSDVDLTGIANGDVLIYNSLSGNFEVGAIPSAPVTSVFGRTGAVVAATGDYDAVQIDYANATSGLAAINVQAAIDEVDGRLDTIESATYVNSFEGRTGVVTAQAGDYVANEITYNNATSGLTAVDTQAAIDEIEARVDLNDAKVSADGSVTTHNDVTDAGSGAIITAAERTKLAGIEAGATADQIASEVPFTPGGNLSSTDVQAALLELDSDAITAAERAKLGFISVTQAVDLDTMESDIALNTAKVSADGSIDTHSDVDTTTTAPVPGDLFQFDGTNWVPAQIAIPPRGHVVNFLREGNFKNDWMRHGSSGTKTYETAYIPLFGTELLKEFTLSLDNAPSGTITITIYERVRTATGDFATTDNVFATITTADATGLVYTAEGGRKFKIDLTAQALQMSDANVYAVRISAANKFRDPRVSFYVEEV